MSGFVGYNRPHGFWVFWLEHKSGWLKSVWEMGQVSGSFWLLDWPASSSGIMTKRKIILIVAGKFYNQNKLTKVISFLN